MRARAPRSAKAARVSGHARLSAPVHLPKATEFSEEPRFYSPYWLIATIRGLPWLSRQLRQATTVSTGWGPARHGGDWHLAYLAFVMSGFIDIQPWAFRVSEDVGFWGACGFHAPPSYATVYARFTELEQFAESFAEAAGMVIRQARRSEPRIGQWLHVDGTECETHGTPVHDCRQGEGCPSANRGRRKHLPRLSTDVATEVRQAQAALPEDEEDGTVRVQQTIPATISDLQRDTGRRGLRFRAGGHWWFSRDPDAGTRAYTGGKGGRRLRAWHGYYHHKAIDHLTGCPLAVDVHAATESEHVAYPRLIEQVIAHTGLVPVAVAGDRGYSLESLYRWNSERGIGSVFAYRRRNAAAPEQAAAGDGFDEHGIPLCKHCGGETRVIRSAHDPSPRLWFRCLMPSSPHCHKEQSVSCSADWRRLVPIPRTSVVYAAMRQRHENTEHVHDAWRDRYVSGGKTLAQRPKRVGRSCHQLRASAALLIGWLRVSYRQGWLGAGGRQVEVVETHSGRILGAIKKRRARLNANRLRRAPAAPAAPAAAVAGQPAGSPPANAPPVPLSPEGEAPF